MKVGCAHTSVVFLISFAALAQYDPTPAVPPEPAVTVNAPLTVVEAAPVEIPHAVRQPIAVRVVGSNVKNLVGEYLGRVENVVVNGDNSQTEFAMLLVNYPTNTTRYTPVPWGELSYVWDHSQVGGIPGALQVFLLNIDKATLERAPAMDRSQWSLMRQPEFIQQVAAFFGPNDNSALGSPGTTGGTVAGRATGGATVAPATVPVVAPAVVGGGDFGGVARFPFFVGPGSFLVFETNTFGTNVVVTTNVIVTNVSGISTSVVINLTNFPSGSATNFAGPNNSFSGNTNMFVGGNTNPAGRPFPRTAAAASTGATVRTGTNLPPTGREPGPSSSPVFIGPPLPPQPATPGVFPPPPSTVAPPGVIAPQVPGPPASPIIPTRPDTAQPPSVPSSVAPPGTVVPRVPQTPPQPPATEPEP